MERFSYVMLAFDGRIKRRTWLIYTLLILVAEQLTAIVLANTLFPSNPLSPPGRDLTAYLDDRAAMLATLIFFWPALALDVKRWHDLGRSGLNVLIAYGPLTLLLTLETARTTGWIAVSEPVHQGFLSLFGLVLLFYFIILAARKGSPAVNRFGAP